MSIFRLRPMRHSYDPTKLEPEDPVVVCKCTKCQQDIYLDECTIDGGMEKMSSVCEDCFQMWVAGMLGTQAGRHQLAQMMGFEVVRHEG